MKLLVFVIATVLIFSWLFHNYFLLGHFKISWLHLKLPVTTAELGDSMGALNGLFSSFAVILALVAVLIQGKELKASTEAQNNQAQSLREQLINQSRITEAQLKRSETMLQQLNQQQIANKIIILQAKQQYHSSEIARMDGILEKINGNREKSDLFNNCRTKKNEHISKLNGIYDEINRIG